MKYLILLAALALGACASSGSHFQSVPASSVMGDSSVAALNQANAHLDALAPGVERSQPEEGHKSDSALNALIKVGRISNAVGSVKSLTGLGANTEAIGVAKTVKSKSTILGGFKQLLE